MKHERKPMAYGTRMSKRYGGGRMKASTGKFVKGVGKGAKAAARGIYKAKTGPIQIASKISELVAPQSKLTKALSKAATPFNEGGRVAKGHGGESKKSGAYSSISDMEKDCNKRVGYNESLKSKEDK
jgi:hypothetical protein